MVQTIFRIIRHLVVGLAAALAIVVPIWFVATAFGGKFGLWTPLDAFGHVRSLAGMLLPATAGLGGAALVVALGYRLIFGRANAPGPGGYIAGIAALAVGLGGIGYAQHVRTVAGAVPPIHDITTDPANPPGFTAALIERRGPNANALDYAAKVDPRTNRPLPEVQAEAYPEIAPILLEADIETAWRLALEAARDMGWTVTASSERARAFEGTAETFWFGFRDDVSVRLTAIETGGTRIDVRSVSRVGVSDLGANAARIAGFAERVRELEHIEA